MNRQDALIKKLADALKTIEWAGSYESQSVCPDCGGVEPPYHYKEYEGHLPNCQIAAALAEVSAVKEGLK